MSESTPADELTFEQALEQLEAIVRDLEDAQLGLEEALARYERGVALIRRCQAQLTQAEQKVSLLAEVENDRPVLQPFRHEATAAGKSPGGRKNHKVVEDEDIPF